MKRVLGGLQPGDSVVGDFVCGHVVIATELDRDRNLTDVSDSEGISTSSSITNEPLDETCRGPGCRIRRAQSLRNVLYVAGSIAILMMLTVSQSDAVAAGVTSHARARSVTMPIASLAEAPIKEGDFGSG